MATNAEWVELRVHGVSGTPPESLLAHPHVAQTDGGGASRFFSAVDSDGVILPGKDGQALEAYHWGHYTSGTSWQALWLLLVPFGLINAAQFMVPAPASRPKRSVNAQAAASALLRLLALLLTLLLVFAVGLTLMDLVAWRWAPTSRTAGVVEPVGGADARHPAHGGCRRRAVAARPDHRDIGAQHHRRHDSRRGSRPRREAGHAAGRSVLLPGHVGLTDPQPTAPRRRVCCSSRRWRGGCASPRVTVSRSGPPWCSYWRSSSWWCCWVTRSHLPSRTSMRRACVCAPGGTLPSRACRGSPSRPGSS